LSGTISLARPVTALDASTNLKLQGGRDDHGRRAQLIVTKGKTMLFSPNRPGYVSYAPRNAVALSDREFLEKTLTAVKRRRGLIHGDMTQRSRVCALGALAVACGGEVCVSGMLPTDLQKFNDSMPHATPERRRLKVIAWLEKRIKELPKCQ
jgi:hypothetical protein